MSLQGTEIVLERDCTATRIPSGEPVKLLAGESYTISQALGGSVTLRDSEGLYRIGMRDIEALGAQLVPAILEETAPRETKGPFGEERVWDALRQCFDPEIPVNIVDLGLIYDLQIADVSGDRHHVAVKMTLTATGCGMGPTIAADAKAKIEALPEVESAEVEIVWDPQWTPHMISGEGRKILGLD
jgi:probable FeS assembly SUF system protein SufT